MVTKIKFTKQSDLLMSFFLANNVAKKTHITKSTTNIFKSLYANIYDAYEYLQDFKQTSDIRVNIKEIQSATQISKPKTFNSNSFPSSIRQHIDENMMCEITYTFIFFERKINIVFITEDQNVDSELKMSVYNKYFEKIIMWLYILNIYSSKQCSQHLTIYLYFTSLTKELPKTNIEVLNEYHVNTAFTSTCQVNSEIVVFRKEEWFKVLMHESFHNFGLDFSDMNSEECTRKILSLFPVNSKVNLYESYTEFWAEVMNALFCSFFSLKNKKDVNAFLKNAEQFIYFERNNSLFQMVKVLDFMGLKYENLYSNKNGSAFLRNTLYKENTNVLAYYVIKTILLTKYQSFLSWCKNNQFSLLQFKKTAIHQREFCEFIEKNYKNTDMLEGVYNAKYILEKLKKMNENSRKKEFHFLANNMRMSVCEML